MDKAVSKVVGTIELCLRVSKDAFDNKGILKVDVRSDYENEAVLFDIFSLITPHMPALLGCTGLITKAPIYAVERINAICKIGFTKSDAYLIDGNSGNTYDGYCTLTTEQDE